MTDTARLNLEVIASLDERYPGRFVADLTLSFNDGRTRDVFVDDPVGTAENPMPAAMQDGKFIELTGEVLGQSRAAALLSRLHALEGMLTPGDLTARMAA